MQALVAVTLKKKKYKRKLGRGQLYALIVTLVNNETPTNLKVCCWVNIYSIKLCSPYRMSWNWPDRMCTFSNRETRPWMYIFMKQGVYNCIYIPRERSTSFCHFVFFEKAFCHFVNPVGCGFAPHAIDQSSILRVTPQENKWLWTL